MSPQNRNYKGQNPQHQRNFQQNYQQQGSNQQNYGNYSGNNYQQGYGDSNYNNSQNNNRGGGGGNRVQGGWSQSGKSIYSAQKGKFKNSNWTILILSKVEIIEVQMMATETTIKISNAETITIQVVTTLGAGQSHEVVVAAAADTMVGINKIKTTVGAADNQTTIVADDVKTK